MRIAIMQPTYLPWAGYFDLMEQVDRFVILDDVQFSKQSWQQRNRIKTRDGIQWLTVPVGHEIGKAARIADVEIDNTRKWRKKHFESISQNYSRAKWVSYYKQILSDLYSVEWGSLVDLNLAFIDAIRIILEIDTDLVVASEIAVGGGRIEHLIEICKRTAATEYLSPIGSCQYLGQGAEMLAAGISLRYHHYRPEPYQQLSPPFVSHLSVIDMILNEGPGSIEIIRRGRRPSLSPDVALKMSVGLENDK
jgi:hypothetical protein